MLARAVNSLGRQIRRLLIVAVVALAAYVSAGRQFMPAVADYTDFVEARLLAFSGLPVSIDSLAGSFSGFNPTLEISGLSLLVTEPQPVEREEVAGLRFDQATLTLDVPASLWQRRWVFDEFVVSDLSLALRQGPSGTWQLRGLAGATPQRVDVAELYSLLLDVAYLQMKDVTLTLEPSDAAPLSLDIVDTRIQNFANEHTLLVDARVPGVDQALQFSYEGQGEDLASASAFAYANIPRGEYLALINPLLSPELKGLLADVVGLQAGGEVWLQLNKGAISEVTTTLNVASLQLNRQNEPDLGVTELADFRGVATVRLQEEHALAGGRRPRFEFVMQATQGSWDGKEWEPFSAGFVLRQNDELELRADSIDLGRVLGLTSQLADVGFLTLGESVITALDTLAPQGRLRNLSVKLKGQEQVSSPAEALAGPLQRLNLKANTEGAGVDSFGGVPMLKGLDGYLEFDFDGAEQRASGFAEVDSTSLQMNLPNVYTRDWDYDSVNGRIDFDVQFAEGLNLRLASNTVVAASRTTRGKVRFTSSLLRPLQGEPEANLELLIGVEQMDAGDRFYYLPDGPRIEPGLRTAMEWVGGAVDEGVFTNSGAIFRGSTVPGSAPQEKTFQSFYRLSDGAIRYAVGWPRVEQAHAFVTTEDSKIDVELSAGMSEGLALERATGTVRPELGDDNVVRNTLRVVGAAVGRTQDALDFIVGSPLPEGLTETLASWRAEGESRIDLEVGLSLGAGTPVDVRAEVALQENVLELTDYGMTVEALEGGVTYDTREGLSSEALNGILFRNPVELTLGSVVDSDSNLGSEVGLGNTPESAAGQDAQTQLSLVTLLAKGVSTAADLIALDMTGSSLDALLAQVDGTIHFDALLEIEQGQDAEYPVTLHLSSDLEGATILAPAPLGKGPEESLSLVLDSSFNGSGQWHRGSLGDQLQFDLDVDQIGEVDGIVFLGEAPTSIATLKQSPYAGIVALGELDTLHFEEWEEFVLRLASTASSQRQLLGAGATSLDSVAIASSLSFIDIAVNSLSLFDQGFADLSLRVRPNVEDLRWLVDLAGPELEGHVEVPFEDGELLIALQRLRLVGGEESLAGPPEAKSETELVATIDSLATLDPRQFPAMQFSVRELTVGDSPYGAWRFNLAPDSTGALFKELAFDFRGLQLQPERVAVGRIDDWSTAADDESPHFYWRYDGENHHSEFVGNLEVADLGAVLRQNGYAPSLESTSGEFASQLSWPGTPAFFAAESLTGEIQLAIREGRFLQGGNGAGALKLISILNFDAVMRRLRFSDDLLRSGLAFDEIEGHLLLDTGQVAIQDRLVIRGPSSLYQITGDVDLVDETILGEMYVTLPVSNNIPWLGLLTANLPIAVGAYLFDQIFGDQVDSLTSAVYTLDGPWEGLEPEFKQAFGSPDTEETLSPTAPQ